MRVVAGFARGHKLLCADGNNIRPTSDRVKEAIFSSMGGKLHNCRFLDLFSGSGAIGIEAMSRGASSVYFVEADINHIEIIKKNIAHVIKAMPSVQYKIIPYEANNAIKEFATSSTGFDIIFMDPPYNKDLYNETIKAIYNANILNPGAILIVETPREQPPPDIGFFSIIKFKRYGKTSVYFME